MVEYKVVFILLLLLLLLATTMTVQRKPCFLFRKQKRQVKPSTAVKLPELETDRMDDIGKYQPQGASVNEHACTTLPICNKENYTEVETPFNSGPNNFKT